MKLDEFLVEHLFHYVPGGTMSNGSIYDEYWWREVKDECEGYIIVWKNGNYHHTYHHPGNLYQV